MATEPDQELVVGASGLDVLFEQLKFELALILATYPLKDVPRAINEKVSWYQSKITEALR